MFEGLFGKIFSLLWQNIFALGHVIIVLNDQILNKYYSHLVTLLLTYLLVYAKFLSSHCRKRKRKLKTFSTKYTFLNKKYLPPKVDNFPVLNCFLLFIFSKNIVRPSPLGRHSNPQEPAYSRQSGTDPAELLTTCKNEIYKFIRGIVPLHLLITVAEDTYRKYG